MREQTTATLDQTTSTTTCPALVHRHCGSAFEPHSKWTKKWGLDTNNKPGKPGWIYGIEIAAQSGISLGVGIGGSFSWIHQFTSFWDQGPAKLLWDSFGGASAVPLGGTVAALNIAKTKYLPDLIKRIPVGGQSK